MYDGEKMKSADVSADGFKNILVTSYGVGGSYCALIIRRCAD